VYRRRESDLGSYRELREPVALMKREIFKKPKALRSRVSMQGTGTELLVVVMKYL
jgi:hypothetical protein